LLPIGVADIGTVFPGMTFSLPGETVPPFDGTAFSVNEYIFCWKFAVSIVLEVITMLAVLLVPELQFVPEQVQWVKTLLPIGVADIKIVFPEMTFSLPGEKVPLVEGMAFSVNKYIALNVAVSTVFEVIVMLAVLLVPELQFVPEQVQ
jgi:hypothetical protein